MVMLVIYILCAGLGENDDKDKAADRESTLAAVLTRNRNVTMTYSRKFRMLSRMPRWSRR